MDIKLLHTELNKLRRFFDGDIHTDDTHRYLYSTDAGLYRELPAAVVYPVTERDLKNLIILATNVGTGLIPRAAGTSLGGQCVGSGIVVDVSRHMTQILEINADEGWVRVQPGVVRDELNLALQPYGLYFGPNTSTSNRAMIGGMVGNNSSGSYSIKYGTTRENVISIRGLLSDGSLATFDEMDAAEFRKRGHGTSLESAIYRQIAFELSHPVTVQSIRKEYPKATITRRNTGYAVDQLLDTAPFDHSDTPFNMSKMLCGSEGTLMLFSEIKLRLHPLPTQDIALICAHFRDLDSSLRAAVEAMKLAPNQCELMDKKILDCTKQNILQAQNRFFVIGDPEAILMIEVEAKPERSLQQSIDQMIQALSHLMYDSSVLYGQDIKRALSLRASGLGVLQNIKSENRAVEFVEDTAVSIDDLPSYIRDFKALIEAHETESVYYAHAGAGELHLRPLVNLKTAEGVAKFRKIAEQTAELVKRYNGSLSGEHGDGRVRSEFISRVLGVRNYELLRRIKSTWDPHNIFNPGKIVDAPPMDTHLKHFISPAPVVPDTFMRFDHEGDFYRATEKCSGSGDCRKTELIGGTLCPSYQATRLERDSTRARANILREMIVKGNVFESAEAADVLSLCLGCKACVSECPSSVDMSSMKSEFLYQYQLKNPPTPLQKRMAQFVATAQQIQPIVPLVNLATQSKWLNPIAKKVIGIDSRRSIPKYASQTFDKWFMRNKNKDHHNDKPIEVYLYVDEFTNYLEPQIAIATHQLLEHIGVSVAVAPMMDSARSLISKGFLPEARQAIDTLLEHLTQHLPSEAFLVGIEPSSILGIRSDYLRLCSPQYIPYLEQLAQRTYTIEEYLSQLIDQQRLTAEMFTDTPREILYHAHCHQKALSNTSLTIRLLNLPSGYRAVEIASGCCGMAGSFGYEHIDLSLKIGEMKLFPAIRSATSDTQICASGTSCRHQIFDGTKRIATHPVEILYQALR